MKTYYSNKVVFRYAAKCRFTSQHSANLYHCGYKHELPISPSSASSVTISVMKVTCVADHQALHLFLICSDIVVSILLMKLTRCASKVTKLKYGV